MTLDASSKLWELPFLKTEMSGELCYTSKDMLPERICVDIGAATGRCFSISEGKRRLTNGKSISCECSFTLNPVDVCEAPRDIRFKATNDQTIHKISSFHMIISTITKSPILKRGFIARERSLAHHEETSVIRFPSVQLRPKPPSSYGSLGSDEPATHYTFDDLRFNTLGGMGDGHYMNQRCHLSLKLLADVGEDRFIPVAICKSAQFWIY